MKKDESYKYYFEHNYHTTVVASLACIMAGECTDSLSLHKLIGLPTRINFRNIRVCIELAHQWLNRFYENLNDTNINQPTFLLQVLLGNWIYNAGYKKDVARLQSIATNIRQKLELTGPENIAACDQGLILLATGILRKLGQASEPLEKYSGSVCKIIKDHVSETEEDLIQFFRVRLLANRIGLGSTPYLPSTCLHTLRGKIDSSCYNMNFIRSLSDYIDIIALYGMTQSLFNSELVNTLRTAISLSSYISLRDYKLDLSLIFLRALLYLKMGRSFVVRQLLDYIIRQQRNDGRLGYFAPEALQLHKIRPKANEFCYIYVPVTVSAIWTFTEIINPDFRLFFSV